MTIRLVCVAEGRPVPNIFWYKDDLEDPLEKSTGSVVHNIKSASKKDSGKYSCLASNQAGKANRTIEFVMYRKYILYVISYVYGILPFLIRFWGKIA